MNRLSNTLIHLFFHLSAINNINLANNGIHKLCITASVNYQHLSLMNSTIRLMNNTNRAVNGTHQLAVARILLLVGCGTNFDGYRMC